MGSFNATAGNGYAVDTTSEAYTATLPASPTDGDAIGFIDDQGTFATNNLTIAGNGNDVCGASSLVVSTNRAVTILKFVTDSWVQVRRRRV